MPTKSLFKTGRAHPAPWPGATLKASLVKTLGLACIQTNCAIPFQGSHQRIGNLFQGEHFLLTDAEQIIIVGGTQDDIARNPIQIGRFIHQHWRIARPGADGTLAALHGRFDNTRTTQ